MPSSASSTTPTSEGSHQGFVHLPIDETIRNNRHTPTSPRIALLSHTSLQQTAAEPPSASTDRRSHSSQRAVEKRWDVRKKSSRDRRKRTSTPHEASLVNLSHFTDLRELDRFNDSKSEAVRLRELLETAMRQIRVESQHAAALQQANDEAANRLRILNENRINAQQEAAKATSERKLYKYQLETAQKEIERAKIALKEIEKQRDEAETAAARAREKARKWQLEVMVTAAREEGRKYGFEAGFNHAKQEKEILAARRPRPVPRLLPSSSKGKEREYHSEEYNKRPRQITFGKSHTDDIVSSPEMSPSQLPIRNLPDTNPPSIRAGPSKSARRRPFQPPPASDGDVDYESETEAEAPPPRPQSRPKTPSVQVWSVDVPAAEHIDESFNSNENPNAAVPHGIQDRWVTAKRHKEIRGSKHREDNKVTTQTQPSNRPTQQLSQFPIKQPPPPPLPIFFSANNIAPATAVRPPASAAPSKAPLPSKSVKFWANRPSLLKTKQHAASWYRSFSFRKKNKPVIDPIAEEPAETPPASAVSTLATTAPEPKTSSTEPPETRDSDNVYGLPSQPLHSWYQQKRLSVPASMKSQDVTFVRRQPTSDAASVSTRVSQFDLLSTPALEPNTSITQRVKGKGYVKEKDSLLSVIKEDSASRGIPSVRSFGPSGRADSMEPKYSQERALGQQSSYHSIQNRHRAHRPPSIVVPDYGATLETPGAAYARQAAYQGYDSNLNLLKKPSIEIDVVPPSGKAPDYTQSPPHTGRNHLSPYHQFNPARSTHSLKNFDTMTEPPRAPTQSEYPSAHSRFNSAGPAPNRQYDPSSSPLQPPRPLFGKDPISRPESVRSSASKHHLRDTPSGTFKIANPDPPPPGSSGARPRTSRANLADVVAPISEGAEADAFVLTPRRETSRASMRSQHSHFSRYNPEEYVDPAYWGVTGPGSPPAAVPARPKSGMGLSAEDLNRAPSRLPSTNSALSYA